LGRKFVKFRIGSSKRHFTVHEDLLCTNSKTFKKRLQKGRKTLSGECSICHEELKAEIDDVTFCRSGCGKNFHEECINEWRQSRQDPLTCPMCRKSWEIAPDLLYWVDDQPYGGLSRDAVQIYIDWLYSGQLNIDEEIDRSGQDFNLLLLKACRVSDAFIDVKFRHAIIAEIVSAMESDGNPAFDQACVEYVYARDWSFAMRTFMVEAFLTNWDMSTLVEVVREYPAEFTEDLCI
jgi:hypothetical protein